MNLATAEWVEDNAGDALHSVLFQQVTVNVTTSFSLATKENNIYYFFICRVRQKCNEMSCLNLKAVI